ncbi:hypothetical protein Plhal703r1_c02g0012891 [Plasmopara halstedii]
MRVHALIAIYQMSAGACTALNLSTIENEIPVILNSKLLSGPANTSHIHLKAAPNRGVKISAMNAEERGFLNYLLKEWHPVHAFQDLDVVKKRQNLVGNKDVIKWRDRLLKFWSDGKTFGYDDFTNLIDENQPSENLVPVYVWFRETPRLTEIADKKLAEIVRDSQQTEEMFQSLFISGVNPETLFQILDIQSGKDFHSSTNEKSKRGGCDGDVASEPLSRQKQKIEKYHYRNVQIHNLKPINQSYGLPSNGRTVSAFIIQNSGP